MDVDVETIVITLIFLMAVFCLLWVMNKFLVKLFHIVSSLAVVASLFVVLYPPYKLHIPNVIEVNLGRYPVWDVPKSEKVSSYLPAELKEYVPEVISSMKLSLVVDQASLLANLLSVFLIYSIVLSIYLVDRRKP